MNENECCFSNILEVINVLQNKIEKIEDIPASCDRPFLGNNITTTTLYNTRPVSFYNCNNEEINIPYTINYNNEIIEGTTGVFRVENVNGCCATCRALAPNPDTTSNLPYVKTNDFATINLNCVAALTCLNDTFIDCI